MKITAEIFMDWLLITMILVIGFMLGFLFGAPYYEKNHGITLDSSQKYKLEQAYEALRTWKDKEQTNGE
jgi:hypothetical protein